MAININAVRDISSGEVLLSSTSGIDLATAPAEPTLFTVPVGQTIVVTKAVVRVTAAAGVGGAAAVAGIGTDVAEGNMLPPRSLIGLVAVDDDYLIFTETKQVVASGGQAVKFGIDSAIGAGTMTVAVDLFGYYLGGLAGIGVPSWQPYTPTSVTWTANVTFSGFYLVTDTEQGFVMDLLILATCTGAPSAGELVVTIPAGFTIDTTRQGTYGVNGAVGVRDTSIANEVFSGITIVNNTTSLKPLYHSVSGALVKPVAITPTAPVTFANSDVIEIAVRIPVA